MMLIVTFLNCSIRTIMLVLEFADKVANYLDNSTISWLPTSDKLTPAQQTAIARSVSFGSLAADAMNEDNITLANDYRKAFNAMYHLADAGLTYGQWDLCYQVGYNTERR